MKKKNRDEVFCNYSVAKTEGFSASSSTDFLNEISEYKEQSNTRPKKTFLKKKTD